MTLVSTRGPVYFPAIDNAATAASNPTSETNLLMDATAEKVACIIRAPKAGILHKVRFLTGTVTTGDTLKVSFQDVDATTGDPDGVVDQFRTIVIADANDNASLITGILSSDGTDSGTKRTVVMGERFAVVFEFNSFVAGNLNLVARSGAHPSGGSGTAYVDHFTAAWAKQTAAIPRLALEYSDGTYAAIPYSCPAVGKIAAETYNSGTLTGAGGDERGMLFQVPFSCTVVGAWCFTDLDGDAELVLYDSDGSSVLESAALDLNIRPLTSAGIFYEYFDSSVTLTKDTEYRVALKPTSVTNLSLYVGDYSAAAVLDALPGGQQCHYTARTDAGAWTPTTTKRPLMGVILSALDDGAGSGSSVFIHTE